ncbi:MAG: hypothetical protein ACREEN_00625, partial [Stellaceae bacterium]
GMAMISISAAEAAAAAFADSASLGPAGLAAAPGVAAAAYATTMGYAAGMGVGAVSAEGGAWDIGPNMSLLVAHPRESVMPASVAQPMRDFFANGGAGGHGGQTGDIYQITIQAIDTLTGAQFLKANAPVIMSALSSQRRLGAGASLLSSTARG